MSGRTERPQDPQEAIVQISRRMVAGAAVATVALSVAAAAPASAQDRGRHHHHHSKGTTTVVLNQSLVPALVGLGVGPVKPGTLTAPGGTYQVAFPITKVRHGSIAHSGGLNFSKAAAGDVRITDFVVDTKKGVLTARTSVNGKGIGRIAVFTLGAVQEVAPGVTPKCAGVAAGLSLTPAAAAALLGDAKSTVFIGDACVAPKAKHQRTFGTTTVVLNQNLVNALVGLGVAPVKPGTLTAPGGTYQVAFPITKIRDGRIFHSGGLSFSKAAAGDVRITDFVVDTKKGVLTAQTSVNGKGIGRIAVFTLGAVQEVSYGVTPTCSGAAAGLTLTPTAASALLGDATATLFIGDACVVPTKHH